MVPSPHEIREALDDATVRGLQIIQIGLVVGVLFFAGFTYARATFLTGLGGGATEPLTESALRTFSIANAVMLVGALGIGHLLFRRRIASESGDAAARVANLKGALLLRLALLEGAALFGVAVCFLATPSGPPANPAVWYNLVSPGVFVLFAAATFPRRDRLVAILTDRSL